MSPLNFRLEMGLFLLFYKQKAIKQDKYFSFLFFFFETSKEGYRYCFMINFTVRLFMSWIILYRKLPTLKKDGGATPKL